MIFININTNGKLTCCSQDDLMQDFINSCTKIMNKPQNYVNIMIDNCPSMAFGGDPKGQGALITVRTTGFGSHENALAEELTNHIARAYNLDSANIHVHLIDLDPTLTAQAGKLFL